MEILSSIVKSYEFVISSVNIRYKFEDIEGNGIHIEKPEESKEDVYHNWSQWVHW